MADNRAAALKPIVPSEKSQDDFYINISPARLLR
jgi:hypothetical protein